MVCYYYPRYYAVNCNLNSERSCIIVICSETHCQQLVGSGHLLKVAYTQLINHVFFLVGYLSEARIFPDILGLVFSEFHSG